MKLIHRIAAIVIAAAMAIGITACNTEQATGYAVNAASLARAGAELHLTYDAVTAVIATRLDSYSAEERQQLHQVHDTITALRSAVQRFDAGSTTAVLSAEEVSNLYRQARSAYLGARGVIAPRMDGMQPGERAALQRFDDQAHALDAAVEALLKTPDGRDISDTVDRVIGIAAGGVRLALSAGVI